MMTLNKEKDGVYVLQGSAARSLDKLRLVVLFRILAERAFSITKIEKGGRIYKKALIEWGFSGDKEAFNIYFVGQQFGNIISKPQLSLPSRYADLFIQAINNHFESIKETYSVSLIDEIVDEIETHWIVAESNKRGKDKSIVRGTDLEIGYASSLLTIQDGSQRYLEDIVGDYALFRPIFERRIIYVSLLSIDDPVDKRKYNKPARFTTRSKEIQTNSFDFRDESLVSGYIYAPEPESYIAIGKTWKSSYSRMTILKKVTIDPLSGTRVRDLYGLRLALGSTISGPVCHRIWCHKIDDSKIFDSAGFFGSFPIEEIEAKLINFGCSTERACRVSKWIVEKGVLRL